MKNKQSGLTMIELVIGLSIMAVVFSGVFMLLASSMTSWQSGRARVEVEQTLRIGMNAIARETQYAAAANVTEDSAGIFILTITDTSGNKIDFKINPATKALTRRLTTTGGTTSNFQPLAGDGTANVEGNIIIIDNPDTADPADKPMFAIENKLVSLNITAMDKKTGVRATMHTKIFCVNL